MSMKIWQYSRTESHSNIIGTRSTSILVNPARSSREERRSVESRRNGPGSFDRAAGSGTHSAAASRITPKNGLLRRMGPSGDGQAAAGHEQSVRLRDNALGIKTEHQAVDVRDDIEGRVRKAHCLSVHLDEPDVAEALAARSFRSDTNHLSRQIRGEDSTAGPRQHERWIPGAAGHIEDASLDRPPRQLLKPRRHRLKIPLGPLGPCAQARSDRIPVSLLPFFDARQSHRHWCGFNRCA